jgi:hypothetical protein
MSNLSLGEIRSAMLQGLKAVGDRFARDPRPTDGSVAAGIGPLSFRVYRGPGEPKRRASSAGSHPRHLRQS